jgi:hypothetical protein
MVSLIIAVSFSLLVAALFGGVIGLCKAFSDAEGNPVDHSFLTFLVQRRNPLLNMVFAFSAWALVLWGIPKFLFTVMSIDEQELFGLLVIVQFCVVPVASIVGERLWRFVD